MTDATNTPEDEDATMPLGAEENQRIEEPAEAGQDRDVNDGQREQQDEYTSEAPDTETAEDPNI